MQRSGSGTSEGRRWASWAQRALVVAILLLLSPAMVWGAAQTRDPGLATAHRCWPLLWLAPEWTGTLCPQQLLRHSMPSGARFSPLCASWDWPTAWWWFLGRTMGPKLGSSIVSAAVRTGRERVTPTLVGCGTGNSGCHAVFRLPDSPACVGSGRESGIFGRDLDRREPWVLVVQRSSCPVPK